MLDAGLKRAATELGLKANRELVYGIAEGYVISLCKHEKTYKIFVDARLGDLATENAAALKKLFTDACAAHEVTDFAFTKTGIRAAWPGKKGTVDSIITFLRLVLEQLKTANVGGIGFCSNCGAPADAADAKLVRIDAHVHLCDSACADRLTAAFNARSYTRKNVGAGLFGALIAAMVAVVPYAILSYFGLYAAPAAFLVPLLISLGYRAFSGRPCAGKGIIVALFSVLFLVLTATLLLCFSVYASWVAQGYIFTRADLFTAVLGAVKSGTLLPTLGMQNLLYCGVFLLLGLVFVLPQAVRKQTPYAAILPF